jgi:inner membrane protein
MLACSALALLPDVDVLLNVCGVKDHGLAGHRGFSHTPLFALLVGALVVLWGRCRGRTGLFRRGGMAALLVGSHGLLDAMAQDGRGIMFAWPFTDTPVHLPWRPIPDTPIGWALFSEIGMRHIGLELVYFLPFTLYALWPRRAPFETAGRRLSTALFGARSLRDGDLRLDRSGQIGDQEARALFSFAGRAPGDPADGGGNARRFDTRM